MCAHFVRLVLLVVLSQTCRNSFVESQKIAGRPSGGFPNVSALFVFGDSTVDPGNNDYILTLFKSNYPPYGRDFIDHKPTGRFCNGKLATDFLAASLGLKETLPPFLDPRLDAKDLITGVSFASAGAGYDDFTAEIVSVIPFRDQLKYFKQYRGRLSELVGEKNASDIIASAMFICSIGTNDFVENYFVLPTRRKQFHVDEYEDFLLQISSQFIQELQNLGARRLGLLGLPPMGCLPVERTVQRQARPMNAVGTDRECSGELNQVAKNFNAKLKSMVARSNPPRSVRRGLKVVYVDIYDILLDIIHRPAAYGFEIATRGCCGTGLIEGGPLCNERTPFTCSDASKFVFWDAVHPTEKTYYIIARLVIRRDVPELL